MKEFFNSIGNWFLNNWQPIVKTLAIIIFGIIIVRIVLAIVKRQLAKTKLDKSVQGFVCSILKFVLYLILIFTIIASLGISITGLTVVISAISLLDIGPFFLITSRINDIFIFFITDDLPATIFFVVSNFITSF